MSKSLQHKIVSFVLFNVLWLSAVAGRDEYIWLTVLLAVAQVGYSHWIAEVTIKKMAQLFAVGLLLEAIAISVGAIDFIGAMSLCGWFYYGLGLPQWRLWRSIGWLKCLSWQPCWAPFRAPSPITWDWDSARVQPIRYSGHYQFTRWCGHSSCYFSAERCVLVQTRG